MKELEEQTQNPVTHVRCRGWEAHYPQLSALAVHLYYTMFTTFEDEPWDIVNQTPAGPEQGLEAYRRTGPRSARLVLRRSVNARAVSAGHLRWGH